MNSFLKILIEIITSQDEFSSSLHKEFKKKLNIHISMQRMQLNRERNIKFNIYYYPQKHIVLVYSIYFIF